jgi:outer membrane protein TolC
VTNQNVAYYRAAYAQAEAVVRANRASLFPTISASASDTQRHLCRQQHRHHHQFQRQRDPHRHHHFNHRQRQLVARHLGQIGQYDAPVQGAGAGIGGQLANATLSARGTLATNYFQLRGIDAQKAMLTDTVAAYRKSLEVTRNKLKVGTISEADV